MLLPTFMAKEHSVVVIITITTIIIIIIIWMVNALQYPPKEIKEDFLHSFGYPTSSHDNLLQYLDNAKGMPVKVR